VPLLFTLAACGALGGCGEGRLSAVWTGSDKGRMTGKAAAIWCADARVAQITGVQGDTGVALLVHPAESLVAGRYRIADPVKAHDSAGTAAIGLRLLGPTAVVGYQGESGTLTVERVESGRLSGRFESTAKVATALAGTVKLNGRFERVRVTPGGTACPR
jgi:hypothetical protein